MLLASINASGGAAATRSTRNQLLDSEIICGGSLVAEAPLEELHSLVLLHVLHVLRVPHSLHAQGLRMLHRPAGPEYAPGDDQALVLDLELELELGRIHKTVRIHTAEP